MAKKNYTVAFFCVALVAFYASHSRAQLVYSCKTNSGRISLQQSPCTTGWTTIGTPKEYSQSANPPSGSTQQNSVSVPPGSSTTQPTQSPVVREFNTEFNAALAAGNLEKASRMAFKSEHFAAVEALRAEQQANAQAQKLDRKARIAANNARLPVTCTDMGGGYSTCSNGTGGVTVGNQTTSSNGSTSTRVGNTTYNSDGTTLTHSVGGATGSNGRNCYQVGNAMTCQ
jgi:hypothetical protein